MKNVNLVIYSDAYKTHLERLYFDINLQKLLLGEFDYSKLDFDYWLCRRLDSPLFKIAIDANEQFVGYVQLEDLHRNNKTAYLGICLLHEARGKSYGNKLINELILRAKSELLLRKLLLKVRIDNLPAIKLYEKNRFQKVGIMREEYYGSHNYWDVMLYEKIL